jgi:hypothetical protein
MKFFICGDIIVFFRVMIINMDFQLGIVQDTAQVANPVSPLGIDQDQSGDRRVIELPQFGNVEQIDHGLDEKISQVFFLGSREYHQRIGIQLLGGKH